MTLANRVDGVRVILQSDDFGQHEKIQFDGLLNILQ